MRWPELSRLCVRFWRRLLDVDGHAVVGIGWRAQDHFIAGLEAIADFDIGAIVIFDIEFAQLHFSRIVDDGGQKSVFVENYGLRRNADDRALSLHLQM